ncbi:MAG: hypothetical protein M1135_03105 [Candidatus Omnitrophica bacterium]|nr:hypothetical protein [Candidatus Omnitrophota bacterium]
MKLKAEIYSAIEEAEKQFEEYPERRMDIAEEYVMKGLPRPYPVLFLNRNADPQAGEILQRVAPMVLSPEERLLEKIKGITAPLKLLNPIKPTISLVAKAQSF